MNLLFAKRCLHNCENKLSIGERAVLAVSSSTPSVSYHWDIISRDHVPDEGFDWERKTTTGRFSSYLAIIGGTFEDGDYSDRTIRATGLFFEVYTTCQLLNLIVCSLFNYNYYKGRSSQRQ